MRIVFTLMVLIQSALWSTETTFSDAALYYSPRCPYSQKVLNYIRTNKMQIPLKDVTRDAEARDELKKYGGHLVVPCLIVDHQPIYNANDIIAWLGEHKLYFVKSS